VTLVAARLGCDAVLSRSEARREALGWLTLGHPETVLDVAHRVALTPQELGLEG
jgi:hypothetical protein